jgi:hypothetical protein
MDFVGQAGLKKSKPTIALNGKLPAIKTAHE